MELKYIVPIIAEKITGKRCETANTIAMKFVSILKTANVANIYFPRIGKRNEAGI